MATERVITSASHVTRNVNASIGRSLAVSRCPCSLTNVDGLAVLRNFVASDIPYLLTKTYDFVTVNLDTRPGGFRHINLRRPPFGLGKPWMRASDFIAPDPPGYLGLWSRDDVRWPYQLDPPAPAIGSTGEAAITDLRFFADGAAKKWPLTGQFETGGKAPVRLPSMTGGLSTQHRDLLSGSYGCVDRIVLTPISAGGMIHAGFVSGAGKATNRIVVPRRFTHG
jgi:hypothetical protein